MSDPYRPEVRAWLAARSGEQQLTDSTDLFAEGLIDSFDLQELVSVIESMIGAEIILDDDNVHSFRTVDSIVRVWFRR
jgi:acyl carrier protein